MYSSPKQIIVLHALMFALALKHQGTAKSPVNFGRTYLLSPESWILLTG